MMMEILLLHSFIHLSNNVDDGHLYIYTLNWLLYCDPPHCFCWWWWWLWWLYEHTHYRLCYPILWEGTRVSQKGVKPLIYYYFIFWITNSLQQTWIFYDTCLFVGLFFVGCVCVPLFNFQLDNKFRKKERKLYYQRNIVSSMTRVMAPKTHIHTKIRSPPLHFSLTVVSFRGDGGSDYHRLVLNIEESQPFFHCLSLF